MISLYANLKMNSLPQGFDDVKSPYKPREGVDIAVFPTYQDIPRCIAAGIQTGAQVGRAVDVGAFTGDISMKMLADTGCKYVLCGHSERRQHHKETDEDIAAQAMAAIQNGLHPIICVGETEEQRDRGEDKNVIKRQILSIDFESISKSSQLTAHSFSIAYEPVWAIGTGKTATPEMAQEMHAFIRSLFQIVNLNSRRQGYGRQELKIIYGGSLKPENAKELLSQKDIDGGLIGGASLDLSAFSKIVEIAENLA